MFTFWNDEGTGRAVEVFHLPIKRIRGEHILLHHIIRTTDELGNSFITDQHGVVIKTQRYKVRETNTEQLHTDIIGTTAMYVYALDLCLSLFFQLRE